MEQLKNEIIAKLIASTFVRGVPAAKHWPMPDMPHDVLQTFLGESAWKIFVTLTDSDKQTILNWLTCAGEEAMNSVCAPCWEDWNEGDHVELKIKDHPLRTLILKYTNEMLADYPPGL
jgi:hypothetical protein